MKSILLAFVMLFALTSCIPETSTADNVKPAAVLATQGIATPSLVPTATIDYQATNAISMTQAEDARQSSYRAQQEAIDAQSTAQAAQVAIIAFTAQAESNLMIVAGYTQAAKSTADSFVFASQTAQPTADAIRKEQQVIAAAQVTAQSGMMTQTAGEADRITAINNATNLARLWWVEPFMKILLAMAVIIIAIGLVIYFVNVYPKLQAAQEEAPPVVLETHYHKTEDNGQYKLTIMQTQVPCTAEQLAVLADGIRNRGMTLAVNQWQGTIVHKSIEKLREFMKPPSNNFAHEIKSKNGELTMTTAGEDWLDECIAIGDAPLPYKTIPPPPGILNIKLKPPPI